MSTILSGQRMRFALHPFVGFAIYCGRTFADLAHCRCCAVPSNVGWFLVLCRCGGSKTALATCPRAMIRRQSRHCIRNPPASSQYAGDRENGQTTSHDRSASWNGNRLAHSHRVAVTTHIGTMGTTHCLAGGGGCPIWITFG